MSKHGRREFLKLSLAGAGALAAAKLARRRCCGRAHRPLGVQLSPCATPPSAIFPASSPQCAKSATAKSRRTGTVVHALGRGIAPHDHRSRPARSQRPFRLRRPRSKIDYAKTFGVAYMICPMPPEKIWYGIDGYKRAAQQLNIWGEKSSRPGMQLVSQSQL